LQKSPLFDFRQLTQQSVPLCSLCTEAAGSLESCQSGSKTKQKTCKPKLFRLASAAVIDLSVQQR
jgi:hypothetical protein